MNSRQARELGQSLAALVEAEKLNEAENLLVPVLHERTKFYLLGIIGEPIGRCSLPPVNRLLERIAAGGTEGGWVVIGCALGQQLRTDPDGAFQRCRQFVKMADVWYAADILGERVPGPALVNAFEPSLERLSPWREDESRWVRRTAGVAVHYWAKRSRGSSELRPQAERLLAFLEPVFTEWDMDAVKGVGWGLKTLGKYYPELASAWLQHQTHRKHRALMLRKARTHLPNEHSQQTTSGVKP